jgi:hypothetical protein
MIGDDWTNGGSEISSVPDELYNTSSTNEECIRFSYKLGISKACTPWVVDVNIDVV